MTAAFAVTRLLDSVLYGVSATDSGSFLRALASCSAPWWWRR